MFHFQLILVFLKNTIPFALYCFLTYVKKKVCGMCLFLYSLSYSLNYVSILPPVPHCLTYNFTVGLNILQLYSAFSKLFYLFWLLCLYLLFIHFRISLSMLTKKFCWKLTFYYVESSNP